MLSAAIFVWRFKVKRNSLLLQKPFASFNPIALRKTKIAYNFGLSECNRVKSRSHFGRALLSREAKSKSHKLSPFVKLAKEHKGMPMRLN